MLVFRDYPFTDLGYVCDINKQGTLIQAGVSRKSNVQTSDSRYETEPQTATECS